MPDNIIGLKLVATGSLQQDLQKAGRDVADFGGKASSELDKVGMSAKATAAALRGVPAQFTDIVTSLQGGQAPMTVFLQQGGQLKDMFGGAGNAAKALSQYVVGLITPTTTLAAAAVALGYAYYQGSKEADGFAKAIVLSGNAAGVTVNTMRSMASEVAKMNGGIKSVAAEAITAMASTAGIASVDFEKFSSTAIRLQKDTGTAISETAKQFSELGKEPLAASIKLNETTHYLTLSIYQQIKALDEQGKSSQAAAVAQNAYNDAMQERLPRLEGNLGTLEKAWKSVANYAKLAWDSMLDVGRQTSPVEELKKKIAVTEGLLSDRSTGQINSSDNQSYFGQKYLAQLENLKEQLVYAQRVEKSANEAAQSQAEAAKQLQAQIGFDKMHDQYLSNAVKQQREIAEATQKYMDASKGLGDNERIENAKKLEQLVIGIREKYKEVTHDKSNPFAGQQEAAKEWEKSWKNAQAAISKASAANDGLSESERNLRDYMQSAAAVMNEELHPGMNKIVEDAWKQAIANEKTQDALKELTKEREKELATLNSSAQSQAAQLQRLQDEEKAVTVAAEKNLSLAQAIELVAIARLQEAQAEQMSYGNEAGAAALQKEIDDRRAMVSLIGSKEGRASAKKAANDIEREFKKASDAINNALTNAIMTAFEKGGSFAEVFAEGVKQEFKNMVLRPTVSAVMAPVSQGVNGMVGSVAGSAAGGAAGSGALGWLTGAGSAYAAFGGAASSGYALAAGGNAMATWSAGAEMVASAQGLSSAAAGLGQMMGAATQGLTSALAAIPGWGWAAMAVIAATQMKGSYVASTGYADANYSAGSATGAQNAWIDRHGGYNPVDMFVSPAATKFVDGMQQAYLNAAKSLGIGAAATTFGYSGNNADGGLSVVVGGTQGGGLFQSGEIKAADTAGLALASSRAIFTALQSSELPGYLAKVFNDVVASTADQQTLDSALAFAGTLKTVRDSLTETRTPLEILQANVTKGFADLATSAATFKTDFVAAIDAGITKDALSNWMLLGTAMDALNASTSQAAEALAKIAEKNAGLQDQLDIINGDRTKVEVDRANTLAEITRGLGVTTDATTLSLQKEIYAQQDLAAAAESAADKSAALITARAALSDAQSSVRTVLRGIADHIKEFETAVAESDKRLTDAKNAIANAYLSAQYAQIDAQNKVIAAIKASSDAVKSFTASIDDFLSTLGSSTSQGESVSVLKAKLSATASLASGGDVASQGKLVSISQALLKASEASASSRVDYTRTESFVRSTLQGVTAAANEAFTKSISNIDPTLTATDKSPLQVAQDALVEANNKLVSLSTIATYAGVNTESSTAKTASVAQQLLDEYIASRADNNTAISALLAAQTATQNLNLDSISSSLNALATELVSLGEANANVVQAQSDYDAALTAAGVAASTVGDALTITTDAALSLATDLGLSGDAAQTLIDALTNPSTGAAALAAALGLPGTSAADLATQLGLSGAAASDFMGRIATSASDFANLYGANSTTQTALIAFQGTLTNAGLSVSDFLTMLSTTRLDPGTLAATFAGMFTDANGDVILAAAGLFRDPSGNIINAATGLFTDSAGHVLNAATGLFVDANGHVINAAGEMFTDSTGRVLSAAEGIFADTTGRVVTAASQLFVDANGTIAQAAGNLFIDPAGNIINAATGLFTDPNGNVLNAATGLFVDNEGRIVDAAGNLFSDPSGHVLTAAQALFADPTGSVAAALVNNINTWMSHNATAPEGVYHGIGQYAGMTATYSAVVSQIQDAMRSGMSPSEIKAILETKASPADVLDALHRAGVPGFAVGTNFVPQDMLAVVHKGEAIVPAAYNPSVMGGNQKRLESLVEGLTLEVRRLRSEQVAGNAAIAANTFNTAKVLNKWDVDGQPAVAV